MVAIATSLIVLAFAWGVARHTRSWSHPAAVLGFFWGTMTLLPLVCVRSTPAETWPVVYILAVIVAFSLPALAFDWNVARADADARVLKPQSSGLLPIAFFPLQVCAIAAWIVNFHVQGLNALAFLQHPTDSAYKLLIQRTPEFSIRPPFLKYQQSPIISAWHLLE